MLLTDVVEAIGLGQHLGQITGTLNGAGDLDGLGAGLGDGVLDRHFFVVAVGHAGGISLFEPAALCGDVGAVFTRCRAMRARLIIVVPALGQLEVPTEISGVGNRSGHQAQRREDASDGRLAHD